MTTYQCPCGYQGPPEDFQVKRDRGVARPGRCKACRAAGYNQQKYPDPCPRCGRHRRLDQSGVCVKCLVASGLRRCTGRCGLLLPALLSFHPRQGRCKQCQGLCGSKKT